MPLLAPDHPYGDPAFALSSDEIDTVLDLVCRGAEEARAHVTPGMLEVPTTIVVRKAMRRVKRALGLTNPKRRIRNPAPCSSAGRASSNVSGLPSRSGRRNGASSQALRPPSANSRSAATSSRPCTRLFAAPVASPTWGASLCTARRPRLLSSGGWSSAVCRMS
jgi:hypothetical protein